MDETSRMLTDMSTYHSSSTIIYSAETTTLTDGKNGPVVYTYGGTVPTLQLPITAGIEKITAFHASQTTSTPSTPTPGSGTTSAGAAETSKSGAVSLRRDMWLVALVIVGAACTIL